MVVGVVVALRLLLLLWLSFFFLFLLLQLASAFVRVFAPLFTCFTSFVWALMLCSGRLLACLAPAAATETLIPTRARARPHDQNMLSNIQPQINPK